MEVKTLSIKERENFVIRLTRTQLESLQKGANFLLSSTHQKPQPYVVELDGSDDIITLEIL